MTRVADSSFLIALFDRKDARQDAARRLLREPEPIVIPVEVLGETLGVVHRRVGFEAAKAVWRALINTDNVEILETADVEAVTEAFHGAKGKLSWVDAAVVVTCRMESATPLCFDEHIARAVRR